MLDPVNGFDEKQAELMRKKGKKSEVERWQEIYTILFGVAEGSPDMPSPCRFFTSHWSHPYCMW